MHRQFHGSEKGGGGGGAGVGNPGGGGGIGGAGGCFYTDNDIMDKGISFNVRVSYYLHFIIHYSQKTIFLKNFEFKKLLKFVQILIVLEI